MKRKIYRSVQGDRSNGWTPYEEIATITGSTKENMCQIANKGLLRISREMLKQLDSDADARAVAASEAFQDAVAWALHMRCKNV